MKPRQPIPPEPNHTRDATPNQSRDATPNQSRDRKGAVFALSLTAALCIILQTLSPSFTGIANNGDFGKVYGWLCLAPRGPETNFAFVQPEYVWSARNYWNSPYHSSESLLAWCATRLAGATHEGAIFDIRWLGAIHALLCLAALAVLLWSLRGRIAPALLPALIFTDICYTAYFNSFYMDAASLCGLLLMVAAAIALVTLERKSLALSIFTLAALLFAASKAQHAMWAILPAAFLLSLRDLRRSVARACALAILLAGVFILGTTDESYRGQALFNVIFYRLAPAGADLRTLGVQPSEFRYTGMHAYMEEAPASNRAWTEAFARRTGFPRLFAWYAKHPGATLGFLWDTLKEASPRSEAYSNFRQSQGQPPGARTNRFALWSNLRTRLLQHWPWHLPLWYAAFAIGCVRSKSRLKYLALGVALLGAGEFTTAALFDTLDATRHLFLFQAATDVTICFALASLLYYAQSVSAHRSQI